MVIMILYEVKDLTKTYGSDESIVTALDDVTLAIPRSRFIVILGASGSGKSTLLNMLGGMDRPTKGCVKFDDVDISTCKKSKLTAFRKDNIGFVFQSYNLLPDLTALENVELSTEMAGLKTSAASEALELVGLSSRLHHFPAQMSGGEQQRVSIARAIAKHPKVLLCDEPTGALDFHTGVSVLEVLKQIHKEQGTSIIFITHNREIARIADMVVELRSGKIFSVKENPNPANPSEVEW